MVSPRVSVALLLCWIVAVSADRRSVGIGFSGGSGVPYHRQQRKMVQQHMTDSLTHDIPNAQPEAAANKMLLVKEPMIGDQERKQFPAGELAAQPAGRVKPAMNPALKNVDENAEVAQPELGEQERNPCNGSTHEPNPGPIGGGDLLSVEDVKPVLKDGGEVDPLCNSTEVEPEQATVAPEHKDEIARKVKAQVVADLLAGKPGAAGARRRKLQTLKGESTGRKDIGKDHGNLNDLVAKLL